MELEYQIWCAEQLNATEFKLYSILHSCIPGKTSIQQIGKMCNCAEKTTHYTLKELQKKDFIRFLSSPVVRIGLQILWVRTDREEVAPDLGELIEPLFAVIQSPEGETYRIPPKGLERFAQQIDICKNILNNLVNDRSKKSREGWECIKLFPEVAPISPRQENVDLRRLVFALKHENQRTILERDELKEALLETEKRLLEAQTQIEIQLAKNNELFQVTVQLKNRVTRRRNPELEDKDLDLGFVYKLEEKATLLANQNQNLERIIEDLKVRNDRLQKQSEKLKRSLFEAYDQLEGYEQQTLKLAS